MSEVTYRSPSGRTLTREVINDTRFGEWDPWVKINDVPRDADESFSQWLDRAAPQLEHRRLHHVARLISVLRYRVDDDEVPI